MEEEWNYTKGEMVWRKGKREILAEVSLLVQRREKSLKIWLNDKFVIVWEMQKYEI